jgi:hypothetical protein
MINLDMLKCIAVKENVFAIHCQKYYKTVGNNLKALSETTVFCPDLQYPQRIQTKLKGNADEARKAKRGQETGVGLIGERQRDSFRQLGSDRGVL